MSPKTTCPIEDHDWVFCEGEEQIGEYPISEDEIKRMSAEIRALYQ